MLRNISRNDIAVALIIIGAVAILIIEARQGANLGGMIVNFVTVTAVAGIFIGATRR